MGAPAGPSIEIVCITADFVAQKEAASSYAFFCSDPEETNPVAPVLMITYASGPSDITPGYQLGSRMKPAATQDRMCTSV